MHDIQPSLPLDRFWRWATYLPRKWSFQTVLQRALGQGDELDPDPSTDLNSLLAAFLHRNAILKNARGDIPEKYLTQICHFLDWVNSSYALLCPREDSPLVMNAVCALKLLHLDEIGFHEPDTMSQITQACSELLTCEYPTYRGARPWHATIRITSLPAPPQSASGMQITHRGVIHVLPLTFDQVIIERP
jgi:hypothetical protein